MSFLRKRSVYQPSILRHKTKSQSYLAKGLKMNKLIPLCILSSFFFAETAWSTQVSIPMTGTTGYTPATKLKTDITQPGETQVRYVCSGYGWDPSGGYGPGQCFVESRSDISRECDTNFGVWDANIPSSRCGQIKNGALIGGRPWLTEYTTGAVYDKTSSCKVEISISSTNAGTMSLRPGYSAATLTGMTGGSSAYWTRTLSNCRNEIMELGVKYGMGTGLNYMGGGDRSAAWTVVNVWVDGVWLGGNNNSGGGGTTPPTPASCSLNVPSELNHGALGLDELSGNTADVTINYSCNKAASLSFGLSGGTASGANMNLVLGGGISSNLCFESGSQCVLSTKTSGTNGGIVLKSTLSGNSVTPGVYSKSFVVIGTYY